MPAELHEQIAELAKTNGRSMNAEIVARLQHTVHADLFKGAPNKAAQDAESEEIMEIMASKIISHFHASNKAVRAEIEAEIKAKYNISD